MPPGQTRRGADLSGSVFNPMGTCAPTWSSCATRARVSARHAGRGQRAATTPLNSSMPAFASACDSKPTLRCIVPDGIVTRTSTHPSVPTHGNSGNLPSFGSRGTPAPGTCFLSVQGMRQRDGGFTSSWRYPTFLLPEDVPASGTDPKYGGRRKAQRVIRVVVLGPCQRGTAMTRETAPRFRRSLSSFVPSLEAWPRARWLGGIEGGNQANDFGSHPEGIARELRPQGSR